MTGATRVVEMAASMGVMMVVSRVAWWVVELEIYSVVMLVVAWVDEKVAVWVAVRVEL